ncbi:MOP flippase family protein [Solirubrobacter taibaiensis]|nr:MOP flippase family protein [Solirubrobacter taibaiensis]
MTSTSDMGGRIARGFGWVGAAQIVLQLTRTVGAIIVARLLAPEQYGLAMLALVFASLVLVFSDLAFGAALVQRKEISEDDRSTAFWVTVGSGTLFTVLGVALSGAIAALYGEPEVAGLLALLSASFIITALGSTHQSLLLREMAFKRTEILGLAGAFVGTVGAVVLAVMGVGAYAIIGQQLLTAFITTALLWRASKWRPHFRFSRASLRDLGGFSGFLVGHRLLYYLHQNADRFIIGRFLGVGALGSYAIAYNVMLQPVAKIAMPVQRVLAPAFARMQDEPERIAAAWARAARLVAMLAVPSLTGMIIVAPDFVPVVLGERWNDSIPVIQLIAWVGMLQAVQGINVDILMARDKTNQIFAYSVGFTIAHTVAFLIGVQWGIIGVAACYAISSTLVEPVLTWLTARALGVSPWHFVKSVLGVFQAAAVMGIVALATRLALVDAGVSPLLRLLIVGVVGAVVFGLLCLWRIPEIRRDIQSLTGKWRPVRVGAPAVAEP